MLPGKAELLECPHCGRQKCENISENKLEFSNKS